MSIAVFGSFASLSVSAIYLGPFLHLRPRLLCLYLCLVCWLLRRYDCGYGWVVRSSVCVCCILRSIPLSTSASAMSVRVPGLLAPSSLCLWLCLAYLLFCLCLLFAWVRFSVCVCICCMSVSLPGLSALLFVSVLSVLMPKALKKELINIAFLD